MATQMFFWGRSARTAEFVTAYGQVYRTLTDTDRNFYTTGWLKDSRDPGGTFVAQGTTLVTGPAQVENGYSINTSPQWFVSAPLAAAVTIAGAIQFNLWAAQTNMTDNAAINARIVRISPDGTITQIHKTNRTTELGTAAAVNNFTETPAAGVLCNIGDRIGIMPFFQDGGGVMASGVVATFYFTNNTAAAQGDSWVQFTESMTFEGLPAGTVIYPTTVASPVTSPGGAATLIDNFDGADTSPLPGWTKTSTGAGWGGFKRASNAAVYDGLGGSDISMTHDASGNVGPDVEVYVTVSAPSAYCGVMARIQEAGGSNTFDGYMFKQFTGASSAWQISRWTNAVETAIASGKGSLAAGDKIGISCHGNVITAYRMASGTSVWQVVGSAIDSTYPDAGEVGIYTSGATDSFNDFYVGTQDTFIHATASDEREAWTGRGGSSATAATNTVLGPTGKRLCTATAGGAGVEWYTKQLQAVTLSGNVLVNVRALESNSSANVGLVCEIAIVDADGSDPVVWGLNGSNQEPSLSDSALVQFCVAGPDVAIADGQRIRIRFYIDDASFVSGTLQTMGSAYTGTLSYNGPTAAAAGDTWLQFPMTLTEGGGPITHQAAGSASGTGSVTAGATLTVRLAGSAAGAGTTSNPDLTKVPLQAAGAASGTGSATAAPKLLVGAGGAASGTGSTTGAATLFNRMSGSAAGAGTTSGAAILNVRLAGSAAGAGTAAGDLTVSAGGVTHQAAGSASGTGNATGGATLLVGVAGSAAGAGSTTAAATLQVGAAGSASGTGSATGAAILRAGAAGAATGTGSAIAGLGNVLLGLGSATGTGQATGAASTVGALAGTAAGTGSVTASATLLVGLAGSAAGAGSATAASSVRMQAAGSATGTGNATGGAGLIVGVAGTTATGTGNATGAAGLVQQFAGTANGTGSLSGAGTVYVTFSGTALGQGQTNTPAPTMRLGAQGTATGTGLITADAGGALSVTGSASGTGQATGAAIRFARVDGAAAGQGQASANAGVRQPIAGAATGTGSAAGNLTSAGGLSGSATGTGLATASASIVLQAQGAATGTGQAVGGAYARLGLSVTAGGTGGASGAILVRLGLAGAAAGSGQAVGAAGLRVPLAGSATAAGLAVGVLLQVRDVYGVALGTLTASGTISVAPYIVPWSGLLEPPGRGAIADDEFMLQHEGEDILPPPTYLLEVD